MNTVFDLAKMLKPFGIILAASLSGITLMTKLDEVLMKHLDNTFASKADVAKIADKVDTVLKRMDESAERDSFYMHHQER